MRSCLNLRLGFPLKQYSKMVTAMHKVDPAVPCIVGPKNVTFTFSTFIPHWVKDVDFKRIVPYNYIYICKISLQNECVLYNTHSKIETYVGIQVNQPTVQGFALFWNQHDIITYDFMLVTYQAFLENMHSQPSLQLVLFNIICYS